MMLQVAVLVLLGLAAVLPTAMLRLRRDSWLPPAAQLLVLSAAGILAPLPHHVSGFPRAAALVLGVLAASAGGSPLVRAVFRFTGRSEASALRQQNALRGGSVVGVLERASVAVSILAHWPQGIAIVLAVKGLARYPELRDAKVSELFIIGTFVSVLWAAGCCGVVIALLGW